MGAHRFNVNERHLARCRIKKLPTFSMQPLLPKNCCSCNPLNRNSERYPPAFSHVIIPQRNIIPLGVIHPNMRVSPPVNLTNSPTHGQQQRMCCSGPPGRTSTASKFCAPR